MSDETDKKSTAEKSDEVECFCPQCGYTDVGTGTCPVCGGALECIEKKEEENKNSS